MKSSLMQTSGSTANAPMATHAMAQEDRISIPLVLLCIYVFVEYARPDFLMGASPGVVILLLLTAFLVKNFSRVKTFINDRFYLLFLLLLVERTHRGE